MIWVRIAVAVMIIQVVFGQLLPPSIIFTKTTKSGISEEVFNRALRRNLQNIDGALRYLLKVNMSETTNKGPIHVHALAANCGQSIAHGNFGKAITLWERVHPQHYSEVISAALKKNPNSFGKILSFSQILLKKHKVSEVSLLQRELFTQFKTKATYIDLFYLALDMAKLNRISNDIINTIADKVSKEIIASGTDIMERHIKFSNISKLFDELHKVDPESCRRLFLRFVQNLCQNLDTELVISLISFNFNLSMRVSSYEFMYHYLLENLKNDELTYLSFEIQRTLQNYYMDNMTKNKLEKLAHSFPKQLQLITSKRELCIQNKISQKFLGTGMFLDNYVHNKWILNFYQYGVFGLQSSTSSKTKIFVQEPIIEFKIKSDNFNEYVLFWTKDGYLTDNGRKCSFTRRRNEFSKWVIKNCQ